MPNEVHPDRAGRPRIMVDPMSATAFWHEPGLIMLKPPPFPHEASRPWTGAGACIDPSEPTRQSIDSTADLLWLCTGGVPVTPCPVAAQSQEQRWTPQPCMSNNQKP